MNNKGIQWLYEELPELVAAEVLTDADAERLKTYYGPLRPESSRPSLGLLLCGVLGATLIGLGIILVFAHNWALLSRSVRAVLSFLPLLTAQALAGWVLWRRQRSRAWSEGSAVFLLAMVGSSIALVGQTYHIAGDPEAFVLAWMLLGLPLGYLLNSSTVIACYLVGITGWASLVGGVEQLWFWPLAALAAPHILRVVKSRARGTRSVFLLWVVALCLGLGAGLSFHQGLGHGWAVGYSGLLAAFYLLDRWGPGGGSAWRRPGQVLGVLGIVVLALLLTFEPWDGAVYRNALPGSGNPGVWLAHILLTLIWPVLALVLAVRQWRLGERQGLLFAAVAPLALLCQLLTPVAGGWLVQLTFNLYLGLLGIGTLRSGLRAGDLGQVNGGLTILTVLIVARFFDSDLPFSLRGVLFIAIGFGFLVANLVARKSRRAS